MSDSDSSSASSASASPRGGSPEPESVPVVEQEKITQPTLADESQDKSSQDESSPDTPEAGDEPETGASPPAEEEPDPDAEPLHVTWKGEGSSESSSVGADFVVVHGVYGGWENEFQAGPGSGSSEWVANFAESLESPSRILRFEYEPLQLFCGRRSRQAIRNCALKLLRALTAKRLIIFVAHDIGGLIIKDALVAAALDTTSWLDIAEMSRILVFLGSPHRSVDHFDMEDRLSRFLFGAFESGIADIRPSTSAISGVLVEDEQANGSPKAFDSYSATLGMPMEKRIPEPLDGSDYTSLTECLQGLLKALKAPVGAEQLRYERELLTLASPVYPLEGKKRDNVAIQNSEQVQSWLRNRGPQMLYVHGTKHVRETAEQLFYIMEDRALKSADTLVLYFSFDRYDVRCDSLRDMLATFLAQIICYFPAVEDRVKMTFARFRQERGWTEADLIYWFERFRFTNEVEHVMFVINHFDECTKGSRKQFLDNFAYFSQASENSWKVVVTSHKPGALSDELSGPWCINLDLDASGEDLINAADTDSKDYAARLLTARPELRYDPSVIDLQLQHIDKFDPLIKHIIWEQAAVQQDWPTETSIEVMLNSLTLDESAAADDNRNLERLLAWVLGNVPEPAVLRQLLTWLLYSVRPLTIWELATVVYIGSGGGEGRASPDSAAIDSLISKIKTWLAGIVVIEHNEIKIFHPRLRNILMEGSPDANTPTESPQIWSDIKKTAHLDIVNFCLKYLSQATVQEYIAKAFQVTDTEAFESPTFSDRENLCSYALQAWTHHFLLSSPRPDLSKVFSQSTSSELTNIWAKGYWALSNPITRSPTCLDSLFPIFAGLGLIDVVEPRDEADRRRGLLEAASKGQTEVVLALIEKLEMSEASLIDVIVAAGAYGDEKMMLDMLDRIISSNPHPDAATWPPVLIYRAAWLGLDRFADRILDLGYPVEIESDWTSIIKSTPLSQAARNFHVGMVRTLLKHNADVTSRHLYDRTALHHVAGQGHAEITKILVEEGKVDIEIKDEDGRTTLYLGCLWGHHHVVEVLLEMGADPDMGIKPDDPPDNWSPLTVAIDDGYEKCVKLLLDKKANPNLPGPSTWGTALRYAAVKGHLNICQMLVDSGADPNSPLISPPILTQIINNYEATERQHEIFEFFLSHNADVNAKDSDGTPVLIHASATGQIDEFIQGLLDHGADVNVLNSDNQSALYTATLNRNYELTKLLLEKGANVNEMNTSNITPLYFAVPETEIVRLLLEKGADPDSSKNAGFTSLMHAAWFSYDETMELLLDHNASLELVYDGDDENQVGWTALACAVSHASDPTVRILAERGANLKHVSAKGIPILHMAAEADTLSVLIEYPSRIDVNQLDQDGKSALHCSDVSMYNVKLLVNAGANMNIQEGKRGDTPLSQAAYNGNLERVKYFVQRGADIHLGSPCDGAAIHQACRYNQWEVLQFLVENGANVNQVVSSGLAGTPLQAACLQYATGEYRIVDKMVDYLITHDADVTVEGGFVGTALHAASYSTTPNTIKTLLDKGAIIDAKDSMGRMPIHAAAFHGIDNFEAILEAGGDISARDNVGRTALHWAAQPGRFQVVEKIISLLPNKEAIDAPDIDGWTPLCWAARGTSGWLAQDHAGEPQEQLKVIKLLLENGANRSVRASVDEQKWTPLKIARFSDQSEEVIELLKHGLVSEDEKDKEEKHTEEESEEDKSKKGNHRTATCDSCRCDIYGFGYHCNDCLDFDICWKCHVHKELVHFSEHTYEERGPEFEDSPDEEVQDDASSDSSGSTDSDSE
ncbi:ankyrin 1 [Trichoderma arundinaceum]|uniref:Ankyrin 1 n=1 Tax=Trichoderma arundinaceum TaxID=490622 RepID=A0A395NMQ7_TRIAR|nr:ankyrin 1 [Trichoderma arundinaceum]